MDSLKVGAWEERFSLFHLWLEFGNLLDTNYQRHKYQMYFKPLEMSLTQGVIDEQL